MGNHGNSRRLLTISDYLIVLVLAPNVTFVAFELGTFAQRGHWLEQLHLAPMALALPLVYAVLLFALRELRRMTRDSRVIGARDGQSL